MRSIAEQDGSCRRISGRTHEDIEDTKIEGCFSHMMMARRMGHIEIDRGFTSKAGAFWTRVVVDGRTPTLTVSVNVTLGSLKLRMW